MDSKEAPANTEAELESFRRQWREEVSKRARGQAPANTKPSASSSSNPQASRSHAPAASVPSHARHRSVEHADEVTPHVYHDLGEKQHGRRLDETSDQTAAVLAANREPTSALEHYERAVEKESAGSLGDSLKHYRKAFKVGHSYNLLPPHVY